jgi:hypothetical protein
LKAVPKAFELLIRVFRPHAKGRCKGKAHAHGNGHHNQPVHREPALGYTQSSHDQAKLGKVGQAERGEQRGACTQTKAHHNGVVEQRFDWQQQAQHQRGDEYWQWWANPACPPTKRSPPT